MTNVTRKRIAVVVNSIKPGGGVANVARAQLEKLSEHFDIELVCVDGDINLANVTLHRVKTPNVNWLRRFGHIVREWITCRRLSEQLSLISRQDPLDFIFFHSHTALSLCDKGVLKSAPVGVVVHGDIFSRPRGTYDPLLTRLYAWASKQAYQSANLIVALSPAMQQAALEHGGSNQQIEVVPNGLGEQWTQEVAYPRTDARELRLLFVGRLSPDKDPLTLVRAMGELIHKQGCTNIRLSITGSGSLQQACVDMVSTLNLDQHITFLGNVKSEDMRKLYGDHHVLCIPSISDPLPTVVLEAMSQELTVIGADRDGIPFMVEHEQTGLLFEAENSNELAYAIKRMAEQPEQLIAFGQRARKKVLDEFTHTQSAKALAKQINNRIA